MKLFTTLTSPYGRIARIVIIERGLSERVSIEVPVTRQPDSPYYKVNPSGRVPYLQLDEHSGFEESALICRYLDHLDGASLYEPPANKQGWELRRLEAMARSMLDGIGVWGREYLYRPEELRSARIIAHEHARADRLVRHFDQLVGSQWLGYDSDTLNMAQILLCATLHGRQGSPPGFSWSRDCPRLADWVTKMGERESIASTTPP